jgi:hypothetical protein
LEILQNGKKGIRFDFDEKYNTKNFLAKDTRQIQRKAGYKRLTCKI